MLVVGDQEMADNAVAVRTRRGVDQGRWQQMILSLKSCKILRIKK